ncbi:MAG: S8 family serine peptidase, partial [Solimonas sp.]
MRRLRVYAFDPQASTKIDTAGFNVATIELPWEDDIKPGPVNEYLEVVDFDPVSGEFYEPIDLNHPYLLARDGLAPSEGDPRFHQQMAFAVAMKTIRLFERALGRKVFWAPRWSEGTYEEVPKLRIYPHALREPNAYYSREKKALLFGYFRASSRHSGASWVFTVLSHDVVVHETTHAILDGLHRRYAEPTNRDSLAFHEAFADIVALLSHFTLTEAVRDQIALNGGRLDTRSLMSGIARQFGAATGKSGALRDYISEKRDAEPDPTELDRLGEAHDRGAILVAAVFDAFLTIYQRRIADLLRLANVGRDDRPYSLHPDLVERLCKEAGKAADHLLRMCIRALDYLPPFDVRFGEFLRAIITADSDLIPNDRLGYRLAVIEAFRRRGIVPERSLSLAVDSLVWEAAPESLTLAGLPTLDLYPQYDRSAAWRSAEENRKQIHGWITRTETSEQDAAWQQACGVLFRLFLTPEDDRYTIS